MKFGKDLKKRRVSEWAEAYVDYNGLKKILQGIRNSKQHVPSLNLLRALQRTFSGFSLYDKSLKKEKDIESQVIDVRAVEQENCRNLYSTKLLLSREKRDENEILFFEKLDEELNKTNLFYKDMMEKMMREAVMLEKQMEALIAFRIKVMNQEFDGSPKHLSTDINDSVPSNITSSGRKENVAQCSTSVETSVDHTIDRGNSNQCSTDNIEILDRVKILNTCDTPITTVRFLTDSKVTDLTYKKEELKEVEERLKVVLVEFYQKLCLLKNYSFTNISAFSKILKKYEKVTSRRVLRSYMAIVDNSYLGCSDEVTCLMEKVESVFIKNFSNSNRRQGMKLLRPKQKREKHCVTFFSGFFSGCSIALLIAVILLIIDRELIHKKGATSYMHVIFPLYSFYAYIVLHMLVYAANIYFWRRYKINYPFIFGFRQGTELGYREGLST